MSYLRSHSSQQNQDIASDKTEQIETVCPETQQIVTYGVGVRRLDQAINQFDQQMKQIDCESLCNELLAEEKTDEIKAFEKNAKKATNAYKKEVERNRKSLSKERHELREQELKTAKLAQKLAQHEAQANKIELERAQEAIYNEGEARRLVKELVDERKEECDIAEQRMRELLRVEKEMKDTVNELRKRQTKGINEFKNKQKEMDTNLAFTQHNLEELKRRYMKDKENLKKNESRLENIRVHAKMLEDLAEKHDKEQIEWTQYIQERNENAELERETEKRLLDDYHKLQNEILAQKRKLDQEEAEIKDYEYIVSEQQKQRKFIESCGKEQLKDQELVCRKAEELTRKIRQERRITQEEFATLIEEEIHAKNMAIELDKKINMNIKMEEKPICVDVSQRTCYQTTEPVIAETQVDQHANKSIGTRIIDGVKNLF